MAANGDPSAVTPSPPIPIESVIQITLPVSTKLDRNNFLSWKSQIEPIIDGFGLTSFLDPTVLPPAETLITDGVSKPNLVFQAWRKQDRFLLGWLRTSMTEGVLAQYVACQTTSQLWQSLQQVYAAVSTARVMELRRLLQSTTRGGQKCGEYFERMRHIADQLACAGEPVSESDLVRTILSGLGPAYNSFVVSLTTRSDPVKLSDLHAFLLSHEYLLESQNPAPPSYSADPVALHAGRGRGRGRRARGPSNSPQQSSLGPLLPNPHLGRGYPPPGSYSGPARQSGSAPYNSTAYASGGRGYTSATPNQPGAPSAQNSSRSECQICRKRGHEALECWYRFDNDAYASPPQAFVNTTTSQPSEG